MQVISLGLMYILQGCTDQEPTRKEIIGVWQSNDGAIVEFKADSTYSAKQIDYYNMYLESEHKGKKLDFGGTWRMKYWNGQQKVELYTDASFSDFGIEKTYSNNGQVVSHKLGITFEIFGKGLLGNKPTWHLFIWIGDPDDMNKYEFEKK